MAPAALIARRSAAHLAPLVVVIGATLTQQSLAQLRDLSQARDIVIDLGAQPSQIAFAHRLAQFLSKPADPERTPDGPRSIVVARATSVIEDRAPDDGPAPG